MVGQDDLYPDFPKLQCEACGEKFELPRKWLSTPTMGKQIFIDWASGELLLKAHYQFHDDDLIRGIEGYLAKQV